MNKRLCFIFMTMGVLQQSLVAMYPVPRTIDVNEPGCFVAGCTGFAAGAVGGFYGVAALIRKGMISWCRNQAHRGSFTFFGALAGGISGAIVLYKLYDHFIAQRARLRRHELQVAAIVQDYAPALALAQHLDDPQVRGQVDVLMGGDDAAAVDQYGQAVAHAIDFLQKINERYHAQTGVLGAQLRATIASMRILGDYANERYAHARVMAWRQLYNPAIGISAQGAPNLNEQLAHMARAAYANDPETALISYCRQLSEDIRQLTAFVTNYAQRVAQWDPRLLNDLQKLRDAVMSHPLYQTEMMHFMLERIRTEIDALRQRVDQRFMDLEGHVHDLRYRTDYLPRAVIVAGAVVPHNLLCPGCHRAMIIDATFPRSMLCSYCQRRYIGTAL